MASKNNVGIIIGVSVVLVGVTAFFIYRGIKSYKDAMAKLNQGNSGGNTQTNQNQPIISNETQTPPIVADGSSTTTPPTTPPPSNLMIQPKGQSILREKPSTLSKKLVTFSSGVQIQVEGITNVGGYQWLKITDPTSKLTGFIRADVVNIIK